MKLKAIILICSAIVLLIGTGCDEGSGPECRLNSDCPGDELCIGGRCLMECKTDKDCLPDGECSNGYCRFDSQQGSAINGEDLCETWCNRVYVECDVPGTTDSEGTGTVQGCIQGCKTDSLYVDGCYECLNSVSCEKVRSIAVSDDLWFECGCGEDG